MNSSSVASGQKRAIATKIIVNYFQNLQSIFDHLQMKGYQENRTKKLLLVNSEDVSSYIMGTYKSKHT